MDDTTQDIEVGYFYRHYKGSICCVERLEIASKNYEVGADILFAPFMPTEDPYSATVADPIEQGEQIVIYSHIFARYDDKGERQIMQTFWARSLKVFQSSVIVGEIEKIRVQFIGTQVDTSDVYSSAESDD